MWPETQEKVKLEIRQLRRLVDTYRQLIGKAQNAPPDAVELSAISAYLHSFYTGLENTFKRVAVDVDGQVPSSPVWHSELLELMASSQASRPALVDESLRAKLVDYLAFRHFFRHGYSFDLRWEKMSGLVADSEAVLQDVEHACRALFEGE